jgi:hypothetical protein
MVQEGGITMMTLNEMIAQILGIENYQDPNKKENKEE